MTLGNNRGREERKGGGGGREEGRKEPGNLGKYIACWSRKPKYQRQLAVDVQIQDISEQNYKTVKQWKGKTPMQRDICRVFNHNFKRTSCEGHGNIMRMHTNIFTHTCSSSKLDTSCYLYFFTSSSRPNGHSLHWQQHTSVYLCACIGSSLAVNKERESQVENFQK